MAAGFVDLGILLVAEMTAPTTSRGALRFVGYERSAFSVAKTLVIWELLQANITDEPQQQEEVTTATLARTVLQVWFSSTWTRATSRRFQAAARCALRRHNTATAEVRSLLTHWSLSRGVTLKEARAQWLEGRVRGKGCSCAALFRQLRDRLAVAAYEVTGAFGVVEMKAESRSAAAGAAPQDDDTVGSVVFFDNPEGTPPVDDDETVLGTLALQTVLTAAFDLDSTFVHALEVVHLKNIQKLIRWARSGDLVVELHHAAIEDVVEDIAAMRPYTMSWSNICDYVDPRDFHKLARACSSTDTMHFGYSMSWSTEVYGANILDYGFQGDPDLIKRLLGTARDAIEKEFKTKVPFASSKRGRQDCIADRFRLPVPTNPFNTLGHALGSQFYRLLAVSLGCIRTRGWKARLFGGQCRILPFQPDHNVRPLDDALYLDLRSRNHQIQEP